MTTIRTFIAIELPDEARRVVTNLQNRLKGLAPPHTVRWTAVQNIHLTLHFLGDTDATHIEKISQALQSSIAASQPFKLTLGGLGAFPNVRRPRILWIGVQGDTDPLVAVHQRLGQALDAAIGFTPEKRPYWPHLTIGRIIQGVPARHLTQLSQTLETEQAVGRLVKFEVMHISLIKSELKPTGSIYTPLAQAQLAG
ncbi:MAG: RNA 2',3'-cyclic phosphodiesterase [Anaerolineae bacterium]|nr:RNA 2',3'-cyclic phosphodiesterase [Anaerolineae bacterium]